MICFIILHYQVTHETINCIDKLQKIKGEKRIIVVDNCSPNGSGCVLKDKYKDDQTIDVVLHNKNDGFARGNNVGCRFAKEKYNPDFYVVMNNDVEIVQSDFINRVERAYAVEDFDVLGPDIYSTTQKIHQSPKCLVRTTIEESRRLQKQYYTKIKSKFVVPLRCCLKKIQWLKLLVKKGKSQSLGIDYKKKYYNVPLHGSCFIFSKKFINNRSNAFFEHTFFYYESEILDYECQLSNMKVVYYPSLKVFHHHNVSTNMVYKNELNRVRFMNKQNYRSITAFLKEYGAK